MDSCLSADSSNLYRIDSIGSSENLYIILARKKKSVYKIVSIKADSSNCNSLKIGSCYSLEIKSVFPENYPQRDKISHLRYGGISVPLGGNKDQIWDLFVVENLNGLCLK